MTSNQELSGNSPPHHFALARTRSEIDNRLQELAQTLLWEGPATPTKLEVAKVPVVAIDLNILLSIPVSKLMQHPYPVANLADICRLLIKRGDVQSLKLAQGLAHKLYALTRARRESGQPFHLYKGIAEIGLGMLDIGIKNVTLGLLQHPAADLHPVDQCLGHWALMSAAVLSREVQSAMQMAEKWRLAAANSHLEGEIYRTDLVLQIFHLLLGDEERCFKNIESLLAGAPEEWRQAADVLREWTLRTGTPVKPAIEVDPYPLFLGLYWYNGDPLTLEQLSQGDFGVLCRARRDWCDPKTLAGSHPESRHFMLEY